MIVELNGAFVPGQLRKKLERHLKTAWARAEATPGLLQLKWAHCDPGGIVIAVEHQAARVDLDPGSSATSELEENARHLMTSLNKEISAFLRVHRN
jgi:hypothetical protein